MKIKDLIEELQRFNPDDNAKVEIREGAQRWNEQERRSKPGVYDIDRVQRCSGLEADVKITLAQ